MDTDAEELGARHPWIRLEAVVLAGIGILALTMVLTGTNVRAGCAHLTLWVGPFAGIFAFLALRSTPDEGRAAAAWAAVRYGTITATVAGRAVLPDPVGIDVAVAGALALTLLHALPRVRASLRRNREHPVPRLRP